MGKGSRKQLLVSTFGQQKRSKVSSSLSRLMSWACQGKVSHFGSLRKRSSSRVLGRRRSFWMRVFLQNENQQFWPPPIAKSPELNGRKASGSLTCKRRDINSISASLWLCHWIVNEVLLQCTFSTCCNCAWSRALSYNSSNRLRQSQ